MTTERTPDGSWRTDKVCDLLADTASAAKAHDEALVKPWREALETLIEQADDANEQIEGEWNQRHWHLDDAIDKARALLRDTE